MDVNTHAAWPYALTFSAFAFLLILRPELDSKILWQTAVDTGIVLFSGCLILCILIDELATFALGGLVVPYILLWLEWGVQAGVVKYDVNRPGFIVERMAMFGAITAIAKKIVRERLLPHPVELIIVFAYMLLETIYMFLSRTRFYTFSVFSRNFAVYTILKSSVFLSVAMIVDSFVKRVEC